MLLTSPDFPDSPGSAAAVSQEKNRHLSQGPSTLDCLFSLLGNIETSFSSSISILGAIHFCPVHSFAFQLENAPVARDAGLLNFLGYSRFNDMY